MNTLSLGGTLTPGYASSLDKRAAKAGVTLEQRLADETLNIPLKKYGTPDEVAAAVEGLLSAFSDHITGVNILHDGGFTRAYLACLKLPAPHSWCWWGEFGRRPTGQRSPRLPSRTVCYVIDSLLRPFLLAASIFYS